MNAAGSFKVSGISILMNADSNARYASERYDPNAIVIAFFATSTEIINFEIINYRLIGISTPTSTNLCKSL